MKWLKRILFWIITGILVLIFLFNVTMFFEKNILKKDFPSFFGYSLLEVVSGSMEPTIHIGDYIVVDTHVKEFHENDIVTFRDVNGSFVTHRLVKIQDDLMITKGDANDPEDEPMPMSSIVGLYRFKLTSLGKVFASFKTPFVSIMILVIGILICVLLSTDKNGEPILEEDEKEFQEYLKMKEEKKEKNILEKLKEKVSKKKKKKTKKKNKKKKKKK